MAIWKTVGHRTNALIGIVYMKYPVNFDAEKTKVCSDGQILPGKGRVSIADAREFLEMWAAQG